MFCLSLSAVIIKQELTKTEQKRVPFYTVCGCTSVLTKRRLCPQAGDFRKLRFAWKTHLLTRRAEAHWPATGTKRYEPRVKAERLQVPV